MSKKPSGNFYTATIDKTRPLSFRIDISTDDGFLFKELIAYIDDFHMDLKLASDDGDSV